MLRKGPGDGGTPRRTPEPGTYSWTEGEEAKVTRGRAVGTGADLATILRGAFGIVVGVEVFLGS
jgi:hypothetical protein